jgi:hypothetical protein
VCEGRGACVCEKSIYSDFFCSPKMGWENIATVSLSNYYSPATVYFLEPLSSH